MISIDGFVSLRNGLITLIVRLASIIEGVVVSLEIIHSPAYIRLRPTA